MEAIDHDLEDVTIEATDDAAFPGNRIDQRFADDGVLLRLGPTISF